MKNECSHPPTGHSEKIEFLDQKGLKGHVSRSQNRRGICQEGSQKNENWGRRGDWDEYLEVVLE